MPDRMVVRRRRPAPQARKVRRLEVNSAGVRAVVRQGTAWTAVNVQKLPGLLLAIASLALLIFFFADPRFYVYRAQVVGNRLLSAEDIYRDSGIDQVSVFFVAPHAVQARLLSRFDGLAQARVALGLPAQVAVRVVERPVRYAWEVAGQTYLADDRGVVLGVGAPPIDVLHIHATEGQPPAVGDTLDLSALQTATALSPLLGGDLNFDYSPRFGIMWHAPEGWLVHFGLGGDLPAKVAVMRSMLAQSAGQGGTPEFLDVTVPSRPFYH